MHASAPHDDTEAIYVASVPLTETGWTQLPRCTLVAFGAGRVLAETGTELARHRLPAGLPPVQPAQRPDWFKRRVG